MGRSRIQIQILPERHFPEKVNLVMSKSLAQKLGIRTQPFWVTYGSATSTGVLALHSNQSSLIRMSNQLASHLLMTNQTSIYAHFDPYLPRLRLGPLLGVLINTDLQIKGNQDHNFGIMTKFLDECAVAGQSQGVRIAVFEPDHIHLNTQSIRCWVKEKGKWVQQIIPFPDVIYNRITSRRVEQQAILQQKLDHLKRVYHIPIFNEKFLNKYQVHKILLQDEYVSKMLPDTVPFSILDLKKMVKKHPVLYVKPNNGSLGSGIIRITKAPAKWIMQSATPNGTLTRTTKNLTELTQLLKKRIGKQTYLIQQGLQLIRYDQRQVDFRVLAQKNRHGRWHITSSVGRIANDQHIVSNLASGGTVRKANDVLNDLKNIPNKPTVQQLRKTALDICNAFEKLTEGQHYAELGIDLAIDQTGKIWLIEINSKPSKTDDSVISPTILIRPSVTQLMNYVSYLFHKDQQKSHSPPTSTPTPILYKTRGRKSK
ncbi:YheC/YheD family protein [Hazenella coriacea]|uniref:Glutathione synthase/RimK-type ligase-like ATP-grasp enzyme n=1 Tax=Hazenella coriacea TaxID=1179467 RepID=A0A4R3LC08_9BACL|nr:YheC/YheD family protein [Hazenella coriacea]TCS96775.1 glutathione synthase/RimK-type ligase-like ATP-grasp enzyme [Hazenella coriacea]